MVVCLSLQVLEGKPIFADCFGNLVPLTKSGQHHVFSFYAFKENRLSLFIKVNYYLQYQSQQITMQLLQQSLRPVAQKGTEFIDLNIFVTELHNVPYQFNYCDATILCKSHLDLVTDWLFQQIRDSTQEPCGRLSFTKEPRTYRSLNHSAICNLNICLPVYSKVSETLYCLTTTNCRHIHTQTQRKASTFYSKYILFSKIQSGS